MDNLDKKVDETWKDTVDKEKTVGGGQPQQNPQGYPQEINFGFFLSSLMIEGLVALGDIENPATNKKEINTDHAKYIIDIISMLEEKTKNNLTAEEKGAIEHVLYELRMRYVSKTKQAHT